MDGVRQPAASRRTARNTGRLVCVAVVAAIGAVALAQASPGDLDPTFSSDGKVYISGDFASDVAVQPGGAVVVVGEGFSNDAIVTRLTAAGKTDKSFGKKGLVEAPFGNTEAVSNDANAVAIQADGKIVVAGFLHRPSSPFESDLAVARLLADGTPDPAFSGDGVTTLSTAGPDKDEAAQDVAIQADGKIVVAVSVTGLGVVARLNADGSPDLGFSGDGFVSSTFGFSGAQLSAVAPGPAGSVYAAGAAANDMLAVRLDAAGIPDPGFDTDGVRQVDVGREDSASELVVQPDGMLVLAGRSGSLAAFARLTATGAGDPGFGGGDGLNVTTLLGTPVAGFGIDSAGLFYAVGGSNAVKSVRLLSTGGIDSSYSSDGVSSVSFGGAPVTFGSALAVAPDGKVLITGGAVLSKDDTLAGVARLRVDTGPADADADGVLDDGDSCPNQFGIKKADGCPLVKRKLKLNQRNGVFKGQLSVSTRDEDLVDVAIRRCLFVGKVTVFERKPGADRKVGKTGAGSSWRLDRKVGNDTYYAQLKAQRYRKTELCGRAKSKLLRG